MGVTHISNDVTYQETMLANDTQLFSPLTEPLLPPEEGTDPCILHQLDGCLRRWPLVLGCGLTLRHFFLIIGLIWTAHWFCIFCKCETKEKCEAKRKKGRLGMIWFFIITSAQASSKFKVTHCKFSQQNWNCKEKVHSKLNVLLLQSSMTFFRGK